VQELAMSRGQTDRADCDALIGPDLDAGYCTALIVERNGAVTTVSGRHATTW